MDLGGSKFKVLQVKVREDEGIKRGVHMKEKTYPIPNELLHGKGTEVGRRAVGEAEERGGSILLRDNGHILSCAPSACFPLHLQLFDHVSESLKDFLVEENIHQGDKQPLAFTFSFPCVHSALDKVFSLCI